MDDPTKYCIYHDVEYTGECEECAEDELSEAG